MRVEKRMSAILGIAALGIVWAAVAGAQNPPSQGTGSRMAPEALPYATGAGAKPPLLDESVVAALAQELSGETAKRTIEEITQHHRTRGSRPLRAAGEWIAARAREYGLEEVKVEEFPADGKIFYGTQRSRPPWDAEFAELWEMKQRDGKWTPAVRWASWESMPITLAQDSESADVTAELVDVGAGTAEENYAGLDVKGKIVLAAAQPGPVAQLAVAKFGAAGIVSYAQNQRTAWWGENENLVRWGHLETFDPAKTFGFMVSLKTARGFRERLMRGEKIMFHATVKAGQHPGAYSIVTAAIRGADEKLREEEIIFSCHLDHPKPGANDNASGCATILEVGRTLAKLIREGRIARPARTIRFVWPPEIEGTVVILNAKPEWVRRIKAAIHMDMVGGGPETKAVFHVTRGPMSVPSFIYDVAEAFGEFVNEQSYKFAATGSAEYPLVSPEGGKEALQAMMGPFTMGSDHQVYTEGSWRIPAIYLNDWPDRYIHTNWDTPAMIDPTKLKRAGFIGATSGYFLASTGSKELISIERNSIDAALRRSGRNMLRIVGLPEVERRPFVTAWRGYYTSLARSSGQFSELPEGFGASFANFLFSTIYELGVVGSFKNVSGNGLLVFARNGEPKGPMGVFGYDYFDDKYGEARAGKLKLLNYSGLWGSGGEYAYEVLNFVDGKRHAQEIRDAVSAEYGPVPLEYVVEYLRALEQIGVVKQVK